MIPEEKLKKTSVYWRDRQKVYLKTLEEDEARLSYKMEGYYKKKANEIAQEIEAYFAKYGKDNVIEYAELFKSLDASDKEMLLQRMDDFFEKYPEYTHLEDVRKSVYKLNRLQGLDRSLQMSLLEMGAVEQKAVEAHLSKHVQYVYNETGKALEGGAFNRIDTAMAKKFARRNWVNGKSFSDRLWDNKGRLMKAVNKDLTDAFIRGDSRRDVVNRFRKEFPERSKRELERLVYTEGSYLDNEAMMSAFEKSKDYTEYEYMATMDSKTSDICRELNGQKFKIKDREAGVNFPPMHPWCRSNFTIVMNYDYSDWTAAELKELKGMPGLSEDEAKAIEKEFAKREGNQLNRRSEFSFIKPNKLPELIQESGKVSKADKAVIYDSLFGYVQSNNSFRINEALRTNREKELDKLSQRTIRTLDKVISNNSLNEGVRVVRYVDRGALFEIVKQNKKMLSGVSPDRMLETLGSGQATFKEKGFTSTSLIKQLNVFQNRDIRLVIDVPAGANVFVTENLLESEMILPKETSYGIMRAEVKDEETGRVIEIHMKVKE